MRSNRIQPWRWFVKSLLLLSVLGIPFVRVRGESALRFDVPTLKLHFFGATIWMDQFFLVLVAVLIISILAISLTILFGRIWCGWMCPQTVIVEITGFADRMRFRGSLYGTGATLAVLVISAILAADIIWYFVEPSEFLAQLFAGTLGRIERWSWAALTTVTFLNFLLVRRTFCATVCPYAKLQGALFDDRTLIIAPDPDRMDQCMHCDACLSACPVGIDVRKGLQGECVACAECIDACARQMQRRGQPSLIGYRFGMAAAGRGLLRRSVVLSGAVTAAFVALFISLLSARTSIDMDIAADPAFPPVRNGDAAVINTYLLLLTNRSDMPQELDLSARGAEGPVLSTPKSIILQKGGHHQVRFALRAEGPSRLRTSPEQVTVLAVSRTVQGLRLERKTVMLQPW